MGGCSVQRAKEALLVLTVCCWNNDYCVDQGSHRKCTLGLGRDGTLGRSFSNHALPAASARCRHWHRAVATLLHVFPALFTMHAEIEMKSIFLRCSKHQRWRHKPAGSMQHEVPTRLPNLRRGCLPASGLGVQKKVCTFPPSLFIHPSLPPVPRTHHCWPPTNCPWTT